MPVASQSSSKVTFNLTSIFIDLILSVLMLHISGIMQCAITDSSDFLLYLLNSNVTFIIGETCSSFIFNVLVVFYYVNIPQSTCPFYSG